MGEVPAHETAPTPGTGWFLQLCGRLTVTGLSGRAQLRVPAGVPAAAGRLIAVEALHQIACRLAAQVRGADRAVPVKVVRLRTHQDADRSAPWETTGGVLDARVLRSGRLSTVETRLSLEGRTLYSATVCTQEGV